MPDLGPPLDWSPEDLDQLSQITPADVKAAEGLWANTAPKWAKDLLKAQPEEPGA